MSESTGVPVALNDSSLSLSNSLISFLILLVTAITLYEYWFRNQRYVILGNKIPGPRTLPLLGNAHLALGRSAADVFSLAMGIYKDINSTIVRIWLGPRLIVGITNAEDAEIILGNNVHLEKAPEYRLFEPWLGDGLLISKGEKWRSHRKMIAPTFHSSILKSFMPIFNKVSNNLVDEFKKESGSIFDCHDYMSTATVDTLLETAMGVTKTKNENTGFDYAMAVMRMCNIVHLRHVKFWLRPDVIFNLTKMSYLQVNLLKTIHDLTSKVIKKKKENYFDRAAKGETSLYTEAVKTKFDEEEGVIVEQKTPNNYIKDDLDENEDNDVGEKKRLAFLDFLIEASQTKGNIFSDEEVSEEVNTIMFEGHDTTAAASSFALCLLGIHNDIQNRAYEEVKEIFQNNMDRAITFNDTLQMKYLERIILETLRMYPPVPIIARKVNEDVKMVSGDYSIPKGTTVVIGQFLIHRNEAYWKNPLVFDPDNFLPENCQNRPYYSYIPFSAGPRSCVGRKYAMLKLKVLLAGIIRKFEIISLEKETDFRLQADIILKREEGFKIKLVERVPVALNESTFSLSNSLISFLILLVTAVTLYEYWFRNQRYVILGNKIPGPKTLPLIGNAHLALGRSAADVFSVGMGMYKDLNSTIGRLWFGPRLIVGIANAEDAEIILGNDVHLEKAPEYRLFEPWLGDGLLISKGEKWRSHRKMIAPTFHSSILKSFMPIFNKVSNNLVDELKKESGSIFDCHDYMSTATVDTLLETVMGVTKTKNENAGFDYAMAVMRMCNIVHLRHIKFWLRPDVIFNLTKMSDLQVNLLKTIHDLTSKVIKNKKENYFDRAAKGETSLYTEAIKTKFDEKEGVIIEQKSPSNYIKDDLDENENNDVGEKKRLAFLDFLIEASQTKENIFSDEEVSEEVNTIMFEGHDTTAAASSFALCLLGIHKDIQKRAYEEVKEIFKNDIDRAITFNDTLQMKYLERIILETLRMYPPVPLIARQVNEDVKMVSGDYSIPKGTTVVIGQFLIHRNEAYWKNPLVFDPDNFLPENCQNRPYYSYIPFSAGPRSCVGRKYAMLKLKVLLAGIIRKFEIISLEKETDFRLQADIILKREEGFKIKLVERV